MTIVEPVTHLKQQAQHLPAGTYPINLDLDRRPCLVVGGGAVAARKIAGLAAAGAAVTVVAPDVRPSIPDVAGDLPITIHRRPYRRGEAASYRLVITATDDPSVNRRVYLDCESAGVWCNSADDLDNCSFILPAVVRRDDVLVTVSTTGRSPAVASWLKRRIDDVLSPHIGRLVDAAAQARGRIRRTHGTTEAVDWAATLDRLGGHLLELVAGGRADEAVALLLEDLQPVAPRDGKAVNDTVANGKAVNDTVPATFEEVGR